MMTLPKLHWVIWITALTSSLCLGVLWYTYRLDYINFDPIVVAAHQDYMETTDSIQRSNLESKWREIGMLRQKAYFLEANGAGLVWLTALLAIASAISLSRPREEK